MYCFVKMQLKVIDIFRVFFSFCNTSKIFGELVFQNRRSCSLHWAMWFDDDCLFLTPYAPCMVNALTILPPFSSGTCHILYS